MTEKKIAWVTGASTGIGAETALCLARAGWRVAVTARSAEKLEALAKTSGITAFPGDITDAAGMAACVTAIEKEIGPIDLALLNAGTYYPDTLENFSIDQFKKQYEVNVFGTVNCLGPVLEKFKSRNKGHLAIVASIAGYRGLPRSISYGSSKAALINMTEALAAECAGTGIKVQIINPGFIKTPLTDKNDFYMPMLMDADKAAAALVRGLNSDRLEIIFPVSFALITKIMGKILPGRLYIKTVSSMKKGKLNASKGA